MTQDVPAQAAPAIVAGPRMPTFVHRPSCTHTRRNAPSGAGVTHDGGEIQLADSVNCLVGQKTAWPFAPRRHHQEQGTRFQTEDQRSEEVHWRCAHRRRAAVGPRANPDEADTGMPVHGVCRTA